METIKVSDEWHGMLFDIRRSIRYHNRRRAFFDRLEQTSNMAALVFGSATIGGILGQTPYKIIALGAAALVIILSSVNLVAGSTRRARDHADFARRFIDLEKKMVLSDPSNQCLRNITTERLAIEAEEPPVLQVLNVLCHNEQMRAMGYPPEQMAKVGFLQRTFAQLFDWQEERLSNTD